MIHSFPTVDADVDGNFHYQGTNASYVFDHFKSSRWRRDVSAKAYAYGSYYGWITI